MVHVLGMNHDVTDLERAFDEIVVVNLGFQMVQRNRRVRVLHLTSEGFT